MNKEIKIIKTYKIKHGLKSTSFLEMFEKAYQIALFAQNEKQLKNKLPSSKHVKHINLKSEIAIQVIRKYYNNKKLKIINKNKVKLILPSRAIKLDKQKKNIITRCLKTTLNCWFDTTNITKINCIEFDKTYAYISCSFPKPQVLENAENKFIGIDLNSTSHSIVLANQKTGKVKKYGKSIPHIQRKYKNIRRKLQSKSKFSQKLNNRNTNIVNDKLHKITNAIIAEAKQTQCNIKIENLKGISKKNTKRYNKKNNFTLNSWPFYKFKQLLNYKAILSGIRVIEIDPKYTSQNCSKCNLLGERTGKLFKCNNENCLHIDHADVNAAFNIASRMPIDSTKNEFSRRGTKAVAMQLPLTPSSSSDSKSGSTTEPLLPF